MSTLDMSQPPRIIGERGVHRFRSSASSVVSLSLDEVDQGVRVITLAGLSGSSESMKVASAATVSASPGGPGSNESGKVPRRVRTAMPEYPSFETLDGVVQPVQQHRRAQSFEKMDLDLQQQQHEQHLRSHSISAGPSKGGPKSPSRTRFASAEAAVAKPPAAPE
jgi:hypothetical protein